ncbi:thioredoxin domain-containing protein 6 isoform X2 [Lepisosteus oculatus]|uniref:thioredoxin domain-containing protein 6 isoform X2 n=1 Tax=Lepisosteus oculatus TaxID=7918 RepID=UPI00371AABB6
MASRKKEVQIQAEITSQEQWNEAMSAPGLTVVDVYQNWCGPCKAVQNLFRKIKMEYGDDLLHFAVAEAQSVEELCPFEGKCEPVFLFYSGGKAVGIVRGVKGPLLQKTILEKLEEEKKKQEMGSEYVPEVHDISFEEDTGKLEKMHSGETNEDQSASYYVAIIKPDAVAAGKVEEIKEKAIKAGFCLVAEEERILTEQQIKDFYQAKADQFEELVQFMSSRPIHVLILSRKSGNSKKDDSAWAELIGPADVDVIKPPKRPRSSRDIQEKLELSSHDSKELASRELAFFFPSFGEDEGKQTTEGGYKPKIQKTLALIRPSLLREKKGEILKTIHESGFQIAMQKELTLTEEQVTEFYKDHAGQEYFPSLIKHMMSGPVLALALTREDAVQHWRKLLGPKTINEAKGKAPDSLRAQFAVDNVPINQLHGSSSPEEAQKNLNFFFPVEHTLAVIKPDAAKEHRDDIINSIKEAGFCISQVKETKLTKEMAAEFYKDHQGKVFYDQLVDYMSQGPSVMMILSKENAIEEWRNTIGPVDPDVARQIDPNSLRAQFARSVLENALHGSSSVDHAKKNIRFIFGDIDLK